MDGRARSSDGGAKEVRLIPSTAALYSSRVGKRPRIVDRTTIGVEPSRDSPFFSALSSTTRPWNRRVEVASTVSPGSAFSWLLMHRLQPGRSRYSWFSYLVRAASFGLLSSKMKPAYFARMSQSPSAFSSSTMLYVGGATTSGALKV